MDFVLTLHSHLPYVLNHGRWPHGTDWITEAAIDTYLPLIDALHGLDAEAVTAPVTVGFTPVLANQLASDAGASSQCVRRCSKYRSSRRVTRTSSRSWITGASVSPGFAPC